MDSLPTENVGDVLENVCGRVFSIQINIQLLTCAFTILMCLYLVLVTDWIGAYPLLFICFISMYVYCILGTISETCNEDIYTEIYNISWYNLLVPQQKVVRLMLMQSQMLNQIMFAGLWPLSVDTGLIITKRLYSIFAMMAQFIDN
ncbi:putative odorant receptor 83c [Teleopsis dalmanni]|uniref:putative odorant receptor 83c n=1 Tax=Teleopsis dalmanni TaxID=139649 RepID=UPI0018CF2E35|nr:putative odorant receptor 83c [Teleopsis dalmanni]